MKKYLLLATLFALPTLSQALTYRYSSISDVRCDPSTTPIVAPSALTVHDTGSELIFATVPLIPTQGGQPLPLKQLTVVQEDYPNIHAENTFTENDPQAGKIKIHYQITGKMQKDSHRLVIKPLTLKVEATSEKYGHFGATCSATFKFVR